MTRQLEEFGALPPQAIEVEEVILGALMLEKDAIDNIMGIISPESFYKDAHGKIYSAILELHRGSKSIDLLTVTEQLKSMDALDEIGGPLYVTQLTSRIASAAHIEDHARIIQQKYLERELIRISSEIQKKAFDNTTDFKDVMEYAEKEIFSISNNTTTKEAVSIKDAVKERIDKLEQIVIKAKSGELSGIISGSPNLDRITGGWQNSDLIIIAGRPSMGKTAFILDSAHKTSFHHPVAFFSLEMSKEQLVDRLLASDSTVTPMQIRKGDFTFDKLDSSISNILNTSLWIDDTPALNVFELRSKARRLVQKHGVQLIIIDYLQLMTAGANKDIREQEVSLISRTLKSIAKELNIPIIALSQLNRGVEGRAGDKRPKLSDLRESGAIEQDADIVAFVHRPEKYGILEDSDRNSLINKGFLIIEKHRNGACAEVMFQVSEDRTKWEDYIPEENTDNRDLSDDPF